MVSLNLWSWIIRFQRKNRRVLRVELDLLFGVRLACKQDMTLLLVSLGISGKRGQGESEVSESERIPNRAGRIGILREEENEALAICPKHRKHLTTD